MLAGILSNDHVDPEDNAQEKSDVLVTFKFRNCIALLVLRYKLNLCKLEVFYADRTEVAVSSTPGWGYVLHHIELLHESMLWCRTECSSCTNKTWVPVAVSDVLIRQRTWPRSQQLELAQDKKAMPVFSYKWKYDNLAAFVDSVSVRRILWSPVNVSIPKSLSLSQLSKKLTLQKRDDPVCTK